MRPRRGGRRDDGVGRLLGGGGSQDGMLEVGEPLRSTAARSYDESGKRGTSSRRVTEEEVEAVGILRWSRASGGTAGWSAACARASAGALGQQALPRRAQAPHHPGSRRRWGEGDAPRHRYRALHRVAVCGCSSAENEPARAQASCEAIARRAVRGRERSPRSVAAAADLTASAAPDSPGRSSARTHIAAITSRPRTRGGDVARTGASACSRAGPSECETECVQRGQGKG